MRRGHSVLIGLSKEERHHERVRPDNPTRDPAEGSAPAADHKKSMGHGRHAGQCGGRACGVRRVVGPSHVTLGSTSRQQRCRWRVERSVRAGRRGSIRHRQQRVHHDLHDFDLRGSEGDCQRGVLHDVCGGHAFDLTQCHHSGRRRSRPWDYQRNHDHGDPGHRATDTRGCVLLGGRGGPISARCSDHVQADWSNPVELHPGIGNDRQRVDREQGDGSGARRLSGRHRRSRRATEQRRL